MLMTLALGERQPVSIDLTVSAVQDTGQDLPSRRAAIPPHPFIVKYAARQ